uniref:M12 family metallo-peptidase n=1 Tax=Pseudomonas laurentiana TaxID=2364649 RepID=UPI0029C94AF2|nr:M12 family metallo-peptidase [Pseudomonas laurentiana]
MTRLLKSGVAVLALSVSLLAHAVERPLKALEEESLQQMRSSNNALLRHLASERTTLSILLVQVQGELVAATRQDLQLDLERGVSKVFHKTRVDAQADGILTWQGVTGTAQTQAPDDQNTAFLTRHGAHLVGVVKADGQLYRIEPLGDGRHAVIKVDASKFPEGKDEVVETASAKTPAQSATHTAPATHTTPVVIRVLTLVSNKAFELMPDMDASVANALVMANTGLENSQINVRLENAGVQRIDWTESGSANGTEVLAQLRNSNDPQLGKPARQQREASRADLLSLLTVIPDVCGLAYTALNKDAGVSIVDPKCLSNHTFAHELGHNFGARHDPDQYSAPVTPVYAHGIRWPGHWRSVMAYECPGDASQRCNRVNYWSNAEMRYQGLPLGSADKQDNARVLRDAAPIVAAYYPPLDPSPGLPHVSVSVTGGTVEPATVQLSANATASGNATIRLVEFLRGSDVIGQDSEPPYTFAWNNVAAGVYRLSARASDSVGQHVTSAEQTVTISAAPSGCDYRDPDAEHVTPWEAKDYPAGVKVSAQHAVWVASWATGTAAPSNNDAWSLVSTVPVPWSALRYYAVPNEVHYQGQRYAAKQWVKGTAPAPDSQVWRLLGPCSAIKG